MSTCLLERKYTHIQQILLFWWHLRTKTFNVDLSAFRSTRNDEWGRTVFAPLVLRSMGDSIGGYLKTLIRYDTSLHGKRPTDICSLHGSYLAC